MRAAPPNLLPQCAHFGSNDAAESLTRKGPGPDARTFKQTGRDTYRNPLTTSTAGKGTITFMDTLPVCLWHHPVTRHIVPA